MVIRGGATQLHSVLNAFTAWHLFCTQLYEVPVFSVKKYSITVLLATFCSLHPGSLLSIEGCTKASSIGNSKKRWKND